jgi:hypothetical protein
MDAVHLARAQTEIESAHQSLTDLGATKHFGEIERHWAGFLLHFERIFRRLEAAAGGKGNAWYGRVEQFRKKDPLLSYLLHARNVDEHGLKTVTKRQPGLIREVGAEPMDPSRPEIGMRVTIEVHRGVPIYYLQLEGTILSCRTVWVGYRQFLVGHKEKNRDNAESCNETFTSPRPDAPRRKA